MRNALLEQNSFQYLRRAVEHQAGIVYNCAENSGNLHRRRHQCLHARKCCKVTHVVWSEDIVQTAADRKAVGDLFDGSEHALHIHQPRVFIVAPAMVVRRSIDGSCGGFRRIRRDRERRREFGKECLRGRSGSVWTLLTRHV